MRNLIKFFQHLTADALGWGVGIEQFGMLLLQGDQLPHQLVVLRIADGRMVQHMIFVVILIQLPAQRENAIFAHHCTS